MSSCRIQFNAMLTMLFNKRTVWHFSSSPNWWGETQWFSYKKAICLPFQCTPSIHKSNTTSLYV